MILVVIAVRDIYLNEFIQFSFEIFFIKKLEIYIFWISLQV